MLVEEVARPGSLGVRGSLPHQNLGPHSKPGKGLMKSLMDQLPKKDLGQQLHMLTMKNGAPEMVRSALAAR